MPRFQSTRCARTYRPGLVHLKLVRDTVARESDLTKGSELSCFAQFNPEQTGWRKTTPRPFFTQTDGTV